MVKYLMGKWYSLRSTDVSVRSGGLCLRIFYRRKGSWQALSEILLQSESTRTVYTNTKNIDIRIERCTEARIVTV